MEKTTGETANEPMTYFFDWLVHIADPALQVGNPHGNYDLPLRAGKWEADWHMYPGYTGLVLRHIEPALLDADRPQGVWQPLPVPVMTTHSRTLGIFISRTHDYAQESLRQYMEPTPGIFFDMDNCVCVHTSGNDYRGYCLYDGNEIVALRVEDDPYREEPYR